MPAPTKPALAAAINRAACATGTTKSRRPKESANAATEPRQAHRAPERLPLPERRLHSGAAASEDRPRFADPPHLPLLLRQAHARVHDHGRQEAEVSPAAPGA